MSDRFDTAEALRQRVLDFAHANPHCSAKMVAEFLAMEAPDVRRLMNGMSDMGELRRYGKGQLLRYTALKTKTVAAEVMRAKLGSTRGKSLVRAVGVDKPAMPQARSGDGVMVRTNDPAKNQPIKNQGGQGALRQRVYVGSCAEWV